MAFICSLPPKVGQAAITGKLGLALIKHEVNATHCSQTPCSLQFDFFSYL
jgi:hypothetical protein